MSLNCNLTYSGSISDRMFTLPLTNSSFSDICHRATQHGQCSHQTHASVPCENMVSRKQHTLVLCSDLLLFLSRLCKCASHPKDPKNKIARRKTCQPCLTIRMINFLWYKGICGQRMPWLKVLLSTQGGRSRTEFPGISPLQRSQAPGQRRACAHCITCGYLAA